ncbi:hypothetical protein OXPF_34200 [Oxobacter pfennigii]|uniref:Uncharacterized protein n=1 Tax=Oxobacter pfennigii TaxID=36849 RepID=A0A0P8W5P0_9CLOT|nr:hypothetical protein [Oxobacter pfennigii]KPU42989.1 hypothetical protein OXPF_34200 [Oxobacter pfennigii]
MNNIDFAGQLADLKDTDYKNTLAIVSIIELLIEKKVITRMDLTKKAQFLDSLTEEQLKILKAQDI